MRYICDRYELNIEQRYWLAFLYGLTYNAASAFYVYNEFPDWENVNIDRMQRWWDSEGREKIVCTTDRRWVRSSNLFVPAVESYNYHIGSDSQEEAFSDFICYATPEERYDTIYRWAKQLVSFGQFSLFLYLEALDAITHLELRATQLDLSKAWSCRNGLCYAYGFDDAITDNEMPTPLDWEPHIKSAWNDLLDRLPEATVWNIETTLCAYRKWRDGKRYIGYYLDREADQIAVMQSHVPDGVFWDVLWQYRQETHNHDYLPEMNGHARPNRVTKEWKEYGVARTVALLT
jgi:hypothetical protein